VSTRTPQGALVSYQGNYAGSVSRFAAYSIDLVVSTAVFVLALAAISWGVRVVTGHDVSFHRSNIVVAVIFVSWQFLYFGYCWAVSGRTPGMAVLGIRVVRADGTVLPPKQAVLRSLVFPLSFLLFGLGFIGIPGSAVVYSWDARAAQLRFLARQAELPAADIPSPAAARPDPAS